MSTWPCYHVTMFFFSESSEGRLLWSGWPDETWQKWCLIWSCYEKTCRQHEESESCAVPEEPSTTMGIILIPLTIIADKSITKHQIHWFVHDVLGNHLLSSCDLLISGMLLQASQLPVGDRSFELPQRISKRMQEVWATQKPRDDLSYREFLFQGFLLTPFFSEQPSQVATATWIPVGYLIFWALAAAKPEGPAGLWPDTRHGDGEGRARSGWGLHAAEVEFFCWDRKTNHKPQKMIFRMTPFLLEVFIYIYIYSIQYIYIYPYCI